MLSFIFERILGNRESNSLKKATFRVCPASGGNICNTFKIMGFVSGRLGIGVGFFFSHLLYLFLLLLVLLSLFLSLFPPLCKTNAQQFKILWFCNKPMRTIS